MWPPARRACAECPHRRLGRASAGGIPSRGPAPGHGGQGRPGAPLGPGHGGAGRRVARPRGLCQRRGLHPGRRPARHRRSGRDGPALGRRHPHAPVAVLRGHTGAGLAGGLQRRRQAAGLGLQRQDHPPLGRPDPRAARGHPARECCLRRGVQPRRHAAGRRLPRQHRSACSTSPRRQQVAELRGHTDYVHAVAWSPDGTRLVSGSGDFTVRVWDSLSIQARARASQGEPSRREDRFQPRWIPRPRGTGSTATRTSLLRRLASQGRGSRNSVTAPVHGVLPSSSATRGLALGAWAARRGPPDLHTHPYSEMLEEHRFLAAIGRRLQPNPCFGLIDRSSQGCRCAFGRIDPTQRSARRCRVGPGHFGACVS